MKNIKFGNTIAKLAKMLGIPHCPGCEKRRLILNEIQKIGLKETAKRMASVDRDTKNEAEDLREVVDTLLDCCKK